MTRLSISNEMAAKYPEFAGRVGEAIENSEYQRVISDAKYAEKEAKKNSSKPAEATAKVVASPKVKAPKKIRTKKTS